MTLIDKAESHDDDLIRRGDALRVADEVFDQCENVNGDDRGAFAAAEVGARIAALPAVTVGVKPLVWQPIVKGARRPVGLVLIYRKSVTADDKLVAAICKGTPEASDEILLGKWRDGAWRRWNTGWTVNGVTHWMPLPEPPEILAALAPTDAATQKGGDAHDRRLRSHEASPGVTAGADAAQAREAALRELIDAYEDIMDYGIVFAKKPQQDRLNAAKEKLKETQ